MYARPAPGVASLWRWHSEDESELAGQLCKGSPWPSASVERSQCHTLLPCSTQETSPAGSLLPLRHCYHWHARPGLVPTRGLHERIPYEAPARRAKEHCGSTVENHRRSSSIDRDDRIISCPRRHSLVLGGLIGQHIRSTILPFEVRLQRSRALRHGEIR